MTETFSIAGCSIARAKDGDGLVLVAARPGRSVRVGLTDRQAAALAVALLRLVPELGREVVGTVLGELVETLPENVALELGLGILDRHRDALAVVAAVARAERGGSGVTH